MEPVDKAYFAGLIDGEGHFSFLILRNGTPHRTAKFQFVIVLRADDRAVLDWVHATLGFGSIYDTPAKDNRHAQARFVVARRAECLKLARLLTDAPLRSKKKRELQVWTEALELAAEIRLGHPSIVKERNDRVFGDLRELADRLLDLRKYPLTSTS